MHSDFVRLDEAAAIAATTPRKLDVLLRRRGIPRFTDPLDGRKYVVRRSDLEAFLTPKPRAATGHRSGVVA